MRKGTRVGLTVVLGAAVFAPPASAGVVEDLTAMVQDYVGDGDITPCRFTKAQLDLLQSQITPDVAAYAPDLGIEVGRELKRWTSGGCSSSAAGKSGSGGSRRGAAGKGKGSGSRATITSLRRSANGHSVKVRLRCPATASGACKVRLSGTTKGKAALGRKTATIARGASKTVTLKLNTAAGRRLAAQGGTLKISVSTVGSSAGPSSRTLKLS